MMLFLVLCGVFGTHFSGIGEHDFLTSLNAAIEIRINMSRAEDLILEKLGGAFIYRSYKENDGSHGAWRNRISLKKIEQSCLFWKRHESYFCPDKSANVTAWLSRSKKPISNEDLQSATWMCDKPIAIDLTPWPGPSKTQHNDVSISVYSGDNIVFSRAVACRDTWMQDFPNTSFLISKHGDPTVPVVNMKNLYPRWFDEKQDPVENLQLFAYKEQLKRHPNAHWFYTVGDDTYLNKDYLLTLLDDLAPGDMTVAEAASKPRWIILCETPLPLFPSFNTSRYEATWVPRYKAKKQFPWCSGAIGWFLSRPAVELIDKELEIFLETLYESPDEVVSWRNHHAVDVTTGLLLVLLGVDPERPPNLNKWQNVFFPESIEGNGGRPVFRERPHYHYVGPLRMITLDQRARHEKIDRIINSGRIDWLVESFRELVDNHYITLRTSLIRYRHLLEHAEKMTKHSWWEVPGEISGPEIYRDILRTFKSTEPDVKF